jgi:hypothetical protein
VLCLILNHHFKKCERLGASILIVPLRFNFTIPTHIFTIEIGVLGLEGESTNEKWTINPCRQGKLDLGVIPADRLGC